MLGARSLDDAIAEFARATGVTAVRGGRHPGRGTENALVSLGHGTYLELIAPVPGASATDPFIIAALQSMPKLTPVGWAVHLDDAAATAERLRAAGIGVEGPHPGSRVTPAGDTLQWVTLGLTTLNTDAAPFFIQWGSAVRHPSTTSPAGCDLQTLQLTDPASAEINRALDVAGSAIRSQQGPATKIALKIRCGRGVVTFATP